MNTETTQYTACTRCIVLWMRLFVLLNLMGWQLTLGAANYNYTYYIVNHAGLRALVYRVGQAGGSSPEVPSQLKSPLVSTYTCYLASDFDHDDSGVYTLHGDAAPLTVLPNAATEIYVRYPESYDESLLNLNREIAYSIEYEKDGTTYFLYPGSLTIAANSWSQTSFKDASSATNSLFSARPWPHPW